jgi:hypothetical protein
MNGPGPAGPPLPPGVFPGVLPGVLPGKLPGMPAAAGMPKRARQP